MKKIILSAAVISMTILGSCSGEGHDGGDDSSTQSVPAGMMALDLSEYQVGAIINVPDSNVAPLEIAPNPMGGADIRVGKNFQLTVMEGPGDMTLKKHDVANDMLRKFVKYVVEEPDAIVWEWQIEGMEPEFHLYTVIRVGEKSFEVSNIEGEPMSEKAVMQMLESARSLRLKEAAPAAS